VCETICVLLHIPTFVSVVVLVLSERILSLKAFGTRRAKKQQSASAM
jgi:hypothetical protein